MNNFNDLPGTPGEQKYKGTRICTYNIMHGGGSRLALALKCMSIMNIDFGIFTETKFVNDMYTKQAYGYDVIATEAKHNNQGGVALFYRKSQHYAFEGLKKYGPNVIRVILVSGRRKWLIIGCYIPPSEEDGETLDYIQDATRDSHKYNNIINRYITSSYNITRSTILFRLDDIFS